MPISGELRHVPESDTHFSMKRIIIILSAALVASSCTSLDIPGMLFGSSPDADVRYAESNAWNEANGFKTVIVSEDEYELYVSADCHISSTMAGMTRFVEDYLAAGVAPFALFLGDAMDAKDTYHYFLETVAPIEQAGCTLFCTPGNHDLYFGQWREFFNAYGTSSYLFEVNTPTEGKDLYISLDSADGTLGTDQRGWLGSTLSEAKGKYRRIIVFTHTHFFKNDNTQGHTSNFNLEESHDLEKLFSDSGVSLVITGHDHNFEDIRFKGVRYLTLAAICDDADRAYYYTLKVGSDETILKEVRIR